MKKLLLVNMMPLLALITILFIGGCDNNTQITSPNQQSLGNIDKQLDELEEGVANLAKSVIDGTQGTKGCANNFFPKHTDENGTGNMFGECDLNNEIPISAKQTVRLWANYAPKGQTLGFNACGKPLNPLLPILTISKSQLNNHPYITWGFKYSHYYRIQKKINNGSWTNTEIDNFPGGGTPNPSTCCNNDDYEDTSVPLSSIVNNYSYRVALKMFDTNMYGENSNVVTYTPSPVTVYISGPTSLTSGQSGTFTANANNGVPSTYTYSWQKFQYCNDRSPSNDLKEDDGTRSVPCGYWQSIGSTSSTVYVSGSYPGFRLKVTVTDINSSAYDYHNINVTLP